MDDEEPVSTNENHEVFPSGKKKSQMGPLSMAPRRAVNATRRLQGNSWGGLHESNI